MGDGLTRTGPPSDIAVRHRPVKEEPVSKQRRTVGRVVIIGGAAAGLACAEGLRRHGHQGEIVIVGDEHDESCDRPPLSKQVLSGQWKPERAALMPPARIERVGAVLHAGRAARLDVVGHRVELAGGAVLGYDAVVAATGVRPRTLPGADVAGVHVLRTLADAVALRGALGMGKRLVVVGGGFLGLEVAATARQLGTEVVVLEPLPTPLASRLGSHVAERLLAEHASHGVEVLCGVGAAEILTAEGTDGTPVATGVRTTTGRSLAADAVLVAIGSVPNVEWLADTDLDIDDGVACDAFCNAGPDVWAAGDVARWFHAGLGRSIRLEHRLNATEQGQVVGRNIVGESPQAFTPTPFFWTDHYDVKIQLAGVVPPDAIERTELDEGGSVIRSFSVDGRLLGVVGWNAAKALVLYRRELALAAAVSV